MAEDFKTIIIAGGYEVLISAEDYADVARFRWRLGYDRLGAVVITRRAPAPYALHRFVLKVATRKIVKFLNGNRFDCRKSNLIYAERFKECKAGCGALLRRRDSQLYCSDCAPVVLPLIYSINGLRRTGRAEARIWTPERLKSFLEWRGDTCAFPGCEVRLNRRRNANRWNLCPRHNRGIIGILKASQRSYESILERSM